MSKILFLTPELLRKYQVLNKPGTHIVKVSATVTSKHFINDDYPRYLIPLRVITNKSLLYLVDLLQRHYQVPYKSVSNHFLTGAIFEDKMDDDYELPIKGEEVIATFDYKDSKLVCTQIELLPREQLDYVQLEFLDDLRESIKQILKL